MPVRDNAARRFLALVAQGEQIITFPQMSGYPKNVVPSELFHEWRINSINAMEALLPPGHYATAEFTRLTQESLRTSSRDGCAVLRALASDAANGLLYKQVTSLITAEVFDDFLEMANHLIEAGHFHAAAGLIGAVLENGLRKVADANGIKYTHRDGIDSLNRQLVKVGVYTPTVKQQVSVWKQIRNDSDHGHFDQVTIEDVHKMLLGVQEFLDQYIN